jgi:peptide/nickel transport system substrate-binding protein
MARQRTRRRLVRLRETSVALVLAGLAGCGGTDRRDVAAADGPQRGGTVVIAGPNDLGGMNAFTASESYTQDLNLHALFLPLVSLDDKGDFQPALAESWDWQGDTSIVFHLRHDVRWHDGRPSTAKDVAFTFERVTDPAAAYPSASDFNRWKGVEVIDSFTVKATLEPHLDPLLSWAFLPIMPEHLLDSIPPDRMRNAEFNHHPVGDGPFRFVEYRANDRWVFESNADFPEALGGRPSIDRVIWRVIPDNVAQVTELLTAAVDLILIPRADDMDRLAGEPGIQTIIKPSGQYQFLGWNGRRKPLDDGRVRRAFALGINRPEILRVLRGGRGQLAAGPIGPFHWGYADSVAPLPWDTTESKRLLDEAGIVDLDGDGRRDRPDGRPLSVTLEVPAANAFGRDVAQMVQADLARVGIHLDIRTVEFATLIAHIGAPDKNFDAVFLAFDADYRNNVRDLFHTASIGGEYQLASYSNREVDAIIDSLDGATNREQAKPLLHRLQRIIRDDQPLTFLWYVPNLYAARDRVRNIEMDVRGAFINIGQWWLADGPPPAPPDSS